MAASSTKDSKLVMIQKGALPRHAAAFDVFNPTVLHWRALGSISNKHHYFPRDYQDYSSH